MALSHIREGAELLAHRIHGAKNLYLNGLQRYHDPKWCQMPLDLYSKAMWILRIILAAILQGFWCVGSEAHSRFWHRFAFTQNVFWTSTRKPCGTNRQSQSVWCMATCNLKLK